MSSRRRIGVNRRFVRDASGIFTPKSISGLQLWLRADMGITLNGSNVSAWADQSGTGDANKNVTQATAAKQPAYSSADASYNNQATLAFAKASSQILSSAAWAVAPPTGTWFVVGHLRSVGLQVMLTWGTISNLEWYRNGGNLILSSFTYADTIASPGVFAIDENGASSKAYHDAITSIANGDPANTNRSMLNLGAEGGGTIPADLTVAEVIRYSGVLSTADRALVMRYLGTRYGITIGA